MKYIYDILVNYKYPLIDFYEWNKKDNIINIKRIPIYRIKKDIFKCIINHNFIIENIDKLKNKTITSNKKLYACIFTNDEEAISFLFNNKGKCIGKSKLLIEEEREVLEIGKKLPLFNLKYIINSKDKIIHYKTISELKKIKYITKKISQTNDIDKLKYIYFDCYNKIIDNPKKALLCQINTEWDNIGHKLYDFFHIK